MSPLKWILPRSSSTTSDNASFNEKSPLIRESAIEEGAVREDVVKQNTAVIGTSPPIPSTRPNDMDDESSSAEYEPIDGIPETERTGLWQRYNKALERRPLLVKSITAFVILCTGDLCGQGLEHLLGKVPSVGMGIDWPRAARFGVCGLVGAPWAHAFYACLDKYLPPDKALSPTTFLKMGVEQGVNAPFVLFVMISSISLLKGSGVQGVREDLHRNYWTTLVTNWKLWLPFSFINMAFVKPTLRVLFVNLVFFGWSIVLSSLINS